tara:strand:- start:972 stop:1778 length:807 start_codon:yes stop_codon:yes gene_type:complete
MKKLNLNGNKFKFLYELVLKRNSNNEIWINEKPYGRYNNINKIELNQYGKGNYCKFKIPQGFKGIKCVYVFTLNNDPIYIGKTINLENRFNNGYGNISPRNCFIGGQSTNCRMNKELLKIYQSGSVIQLWYFETLNYNEIERKLIEKIKPNWNIQYNKKKQQKVSSKIKVVTKPIISKTEKKMKKGNVRVADFKKKLEEIISKAREYNLNAIEVRSGNLHSLMNAHARMPTCCNAMRQLMRDEDEELSAPPGGFGANLFIRYDISSRN